MEFEPNSYGSLVKRLIGEPRPNELGPGSPNRAMLPVLESLTDDLFDPSRVGDPDMAAACRAGLWLYHDFLDQSHNISQEVQTPTGSYWHGIMHRREPDPSNAKYWFRRVGEHPVFEDLVAEARRIASEPGRAISARAQFLVSQEAWDPFAWIDLCEAARVGKAKDEVLCREIGLVEWQLLFDACWQSALGGQQ
jgi:hypothetical protein